MDHISPIIELYGLNIDLSAIIMITVTCIIVFAIGKLATRNLSMDNPSKMQSFLEWVVDFVRNIISSAMDMKKGKAFLTLGLTLIMFIFVGNMLGLPFAIVTDHKEQMSFFGHEVVSITNYLAEGGKSAHVLWWKSPTADPSVTMGLALLVIFLTHFLGLTKNTGPYLKHYFEPNILFFPLNLLKEISKLLTLGMRLFGNIFAGEVLIATILMAGWFGILPLIVWQGFSIFVGSIQAFIFTVLTMVYMSQAIEHKH